MADEDPIKLETKGSALVITLNRPDALNAQNQPMRDQLAEAVQRLDTDDSLRVGIVRGAGRAFSAGADLKELRGTERLDERHGTGSREERTGEAKAAMYRHFIALATAKKPLIAVVHGWTVGGGLEVAICCDLRVAAEDARFALPEPRTIGSLPGVAIHRLPHLIPRGEAMRLFLTGEPIDARRAHAIGLVQEVAADTDAALQVALGLAEAIAQANPDAVARVKTAVPPIPSPLSQ